MSFCPIDDRALLRCLREHYGIKASGLAWLELGHAGETWTCRTVSSDWFIKVKRSVDPSGSAVAAHLSNLGIPVLAPVPSLAGSLTTECQGLRILVYPFLPGAPVQFRQLSVTQWQHLGAILHRIHTAPLSGGLRRLLPHESFAPCDEELLATIDAAAHAQQSTVSLRGQAAKLWLDQRPAVAYTVTRAAVQGTAARAASAMRCCLCHADFQQDNILLDTNGKWTILDWDTPAWAPPERDIRFIDLAYRPYLLRGYGAVDLSAETEAYFQIEWRLNELFDCADRLLLRQSAAAEEQSWALDSLTRLLRSCTAAAKRAAAT